MLPPRIPKKPKRASRWRSQAHLSFVRRFYCSVVGCGDMPIEAAHVRNGSGAGIGQKPDDWRAVSLCAHHHRKQHEMGEESFWGCVRQDPEELIASFIKGSPKRREIEEAMKERGH
jgi:hypothetical protein